MKIVENLIYKLFHKEIVELDPNIEIISLNAEDPNDPAWQEVPEYDALFQSHTFRQSGP